MTKKQTTFAQVRASQRAFEVACWDFLADKYREAGKDTKDLGERPQLN